MREGTAPPSRRANENAYAYLMRTCLADGMDPSVATMEIVRKTGLGKATVYAWRASLRGRPPSPSRLRKGRVGPTLQSAFDTLDANYPQYARDWTLMSPRIAREVGFDRQVVLQWRRRNLAAQIAEGGPEPTCGCGRPAMHRGSCGILPLDVRREAAARIAAGGDFLAIARRLGVEPCTALSWLTLPERRDATAIRRERMRRAAELASRRRPVDRTHEAILAGLNPASPEYDDAVQEAYLAMLEGGLSVEEATKVGRRRANATASIGWNATSLDAPLRADSSTTRMDLLADEAMQCVDMLGSIDRRRLEGAGGAPPFEQYAPRPIPTIQHETPEMTEVAITTDAAGEAALLDRVIAAHESARTPLSHIAGRARIRNVDVGAILKRRTAPGRARLARLADFYGIPHDVPDDVKAPRPFGGVNPKAAGRKAKGRAATAAIPKSQVTRKTSATKRTSAPITATTHAATSETTHRVAGIDQSDRDASTTAPAGDAAIEAIDAMISALQDARAAHLALADARREAGEARTALDAERARAEAAEAELVRLQTGIERMRAMVDAFAPANDADGLRAAA